MADALGQPPVVAESLWTHTPPNPRAEALACAQEHDEELRQRRQNQSQPAPTRSVQHAVPHAHNTASGARVTPARSCATSWTGGMIPHSSLGLARTSPQWRCFCVAFLSRTTPRNRRSTGTSGHWWKPPPFNRRRAPRHDTSSRPLAPSGEWGHTSRITPSTHHYSCWA